MLNWNDSQSSHRTLYTLSVPQRQLSVVMETVPKFSGEDNPGSVSWLDFQIAVQPLQLHNFNTKDSVLQFLNKIMPPAIRVITTKDKETTVQDIFKKLKAIHGTPIKVCAWIIKQHLGFGSIPETGKGLIFHTLTQHKELIDKTDTYFDSLHQKDKEEAIQMFTPYAYSLYCLLPASICTQTNKQLAKEGKKEWDISEGTSTREFYQFFKKAVTIARQ